MVNGLIEKWVEWARNTDHAASCVHWKPWTSKDSCSCGLSNLLSESNTIETNALLNPQDERGAAILGLEEILRHMPSKDGRWALEYAISKLRPAQKAGEQP